MFLYTRSIEESGGWGGSGRKKGGSFCQVTWSDNEPRLQRHLMKKRLLQVMDSLIMSVLRFCLEFSGRDQANLVCIQKTLNNVLPGEKIINEGGCSNNHEFCQVPDSEVEVR